jgi:hypothetical protein
MEFDESSLTSNDPSCAAVIPTGLPRTCPFDNKPSQKVLGCGRSRSIGLDRCCWSGSRLSPVWGAVESPHVGNDLPAYLLRESLPGRHTLVGRAGRNEPKHFPVGCFLRGSLVQRRNVSRSASAYPMARSAVFRIQPLARFNRRGLAGQGVLQLCARGWRVMKVRVLGERGCLQNHA